MKRDLNKSFIFVEFSTRFYDNGVRLSLCMLESKGSLFGIPVGNCPCHIGSHRLVAEKTHPLKGEEPWLPSLVTMLLLQSRICRPKYSAKVGLLMKIVASLVRLTFVQCTRAEHLLCRWVTFSFLSFAFWEPTCIFLLRSKASSTLLA